MARRKPRVSHRSWSSFSGRIGSAHDRADQFLFEPLEDRSMLATFVPGEVLIQYDTSVDVASRTNARAQVAGNLLEQIQTNTMKASGQGVMERIALGKGISVPDAIELLGASPGVRYVEPNWVYTPSDISNDTHYLNSNLWGMYSDDSPATVGPAGTTNQFGIQAEEAWNNGFLGSNSVFIGVIDEGIQYTHPDLAANVWTNPFDPIDGVDNDGNGKIDDSQGWDFFTNDRTVYDGTGDDHGTHVAGTIGAKGGNGAGVAGVNWNVTMISTKFLGPSGGSTSGAVQALDYLTDLKTRHGLNIVATSNSWGGGGFSQSLLDAITRAANQGILFVAAAGNSASNNDSAAFYPANYNTTAGAGYDAVIAVASITNTGARSSFSSYGATTVDLGAPGSTIYSTLPTNTYGAYSGTSMATPHVSGAIALYASTHPGATALQMRNALLSNTTATSSLAGITVTGGRLDVSKLMGAPAALPGLTISNVSVSEGNSGTVLANFVVTLSASSSDTVTVNFATANGSAVAPGDYTGASGVVTFVPGDVSETISVVVQGDTNVEANETFTVALSGAANATISDSSATGTIVNDDASGAGTLSINNASAFENLGPIVFTVTLSAPSGSTVTVNYGTSNGTAKGGNGKNSDFVHQNGTLTFTAGQTSKSISITLKNNNVPEANETFFVNLSGASGAAISDNQGIGTILNDDSGGAALAQSQIGAINVVATTLLPQAFAVVAQREMVQGNEKALEVLAEIRERVNPAAYKGIDNAQKRISDGGAPTAAGVIGHPVTTQGSENALAVLSEVRERVNPAAYKGIDNALDRVLNGGKPDASSD